MALSAGWTIEYVLDNVTATWLAALREHWRKHPPVHKIVASFAGYKPPAKKAKNKKASAHDDAVAQLRALFPSGRIE